MTQQETWKKINDKHADLLFTLWERWQCEKEYEDITDYLKTIQKHIPEVFGITKRPFGIKVKCDDGNIKIDVVSQGAYVKIKAKSI